MQKEKEEYEANLAKQKAETEAKNREIEALKTMPHLMNINSDPMMTGK